MDFDDFHVAGDIFLHSMDDHPVRRKSIYERFQRFLPPETIAYIQYCLLRLPFILIYDYLFTEHFSSIVQTAFKYSLEIIDRMDRRTFLYPISTILHSQAFHWLLQMNLSITIPILGLMVLIFFLWCSDRRLVMFYSYTISLLVIYFDYQMTSLPDHHASSASWNMCIFQFILSSIYIQMLNIRPKVPSYSSQTRLCHFAPFALLISQYCLPSSCNLIVLRGYYLLWTAVHLAELFLFHYQTIVDLVQNRFLDELYHLYHNFGFQTLFDYLHTHISILTLLKIFWLTKIIVLPLGLRMVQKNPSIANSTINANFEMNETSVDLANNLTDSYNETMWKTMYFTSLFYGTETIFTLVSLACLVSHVMKNISHRLFRLLHLWTEDVEQIGTLVGVMFFLLLFQSNITQLDLDRRHVPLMKAFSLLIVALFHFFHTILEPQLLKVAMQTMTMKMAFVSSENEKEKQSSKSIFSSPILRAYHHEHIYTCMSILILLCFYIYLLWRITSFSTWLLAVTAFSLELIIRLFASFAQFTVYVLDAHHCFTNTDAFDDHLFRIKTITSSLEFLLGVFLLFNGIYILCFESCGFLRAVMLATHAYLNIIRNLRRAWQIYRNRQLIWNTLNQLPLATQEQIEQYNDICSICYQSLTVNTTLITPCAHLFHQNCLQKAFNTTQSCVLCSRPILINQEKQHRD